MGLPKVNVTFSEAARTLLERSDVGIVGLILRDNVPEVNPVVATTIDDIPSTLSEDNKKQIEMALMGAEQPPQKVISYVIPFDEEEGDDPVTYDYSEALDYFTGVEIGYLAAPECGSDGMISDIEAWIVLQRADGRIVKAVLPNTTADNAGVINYATNTVTVSDEESYTAERFCSRIAGMLASIPLTESSTFKAIPELVGCEKKTKTEMDTDIDDGKLIVFWDGEKVKIARGVNSFQTTTPTMGNQFKKIRIVDIMDHIQQDIRMLAEDNYIGRYSNNYDNKLILLTAIQDYLTELEKQGVIRVSSCDIDEKANKVYLESKGIDTKDMTAKEIREAATDDKVFLTATITIYDAIEDIVLPITV